MNLKNWLNSIKENANQDSIQLIIIANKCDLAGEREISRGEIDQKAKDLNVEVFETSAKENINIDEAFDTIIDKVFKNVYHKPKGFDLNRSNSEGGNNGKKNCC
jgi:GTPase SAR1 family protein